MDTVTEKVRIHNGQAESATQIYKKPGHISAILYRLPLPVTKVLVFSCGDSYPICPRCDCTAGREYVDVQRNEYTMELKNPAAVISEAVIIGFGSSSCRSR